MHDIKVTSDGSRESVPDPSQILSETPLTRNVNAISCKEKSLLKVCVVLDPEGKQTHALCKIDSGAETNITPNSLYNQLSPGVMNLYKVDSIWWVRNPKPGIVPSLHQGPQQPESETNLSRSS